MKVFVTKYALTHGIEIETGEPCEDNLFLIDGMYTNYLDEKYWHDNYHDALEAAEIMRSRKIASLQKSIAKLRAVEFFDPDNIVF